MSGLLCGSSRLLEVRFEREVSYHPCNITEIFFNRIARRGNSIAFETETLSLASKVNGKSMVQSHFCYLDLNSAFSRRACKTGVVPEARLIAEASNLNWTLHFRKFVPKKSVQAMIPLKHSTPVSLPFYWRRPSYLLQRFGPGVVGARD